MRLWICHGRWGFRLLDRARAMPLGSDGAAAGLVGFDGSGGDRMRRSGRSMSMLAVAGVTVLAVAVLAPTSAYAPPAPASSCTVNGVPSTTVPGAEIST